MFIIEFSGLSNFYSDSCESFFRQIFLVNFFSANQNKDGGFVNNLCFVSSNVFCVDLISYIYYFVKILLVFVFDLRNFYLKNILSLSSTCFEHQ